jgi:hypothetical protein
VVPRAARQTQIAGETRRRLLGTIIRQTLRFARTMRSLTCRAAFPDRNPARHPATAAGQDRVAEASASDRRVSGVADGGALRTSWFGTAAAARRVPDENPLRRAALRIYGKWSAGLILQADAGNSTKRRPRLPGCHSKGPSFAAGTLLANRWREQRDGAPVILRLMAHASMAMPLQPASLRFQRRAGHTHAQQECGACAGGI